MNRNREIIEEPKPTACRRGVIPGNGKQDVSRERAAVRVTEPVPCVGRSVSVVDKPFVLVMYRTFRHALRRGFWEKIGSLAPYGPVTLMGEAERKIAEPWFVARGAAPSGYRQGIGEGSPLRSVR